MLRNVAVLLAPDAGIAPAAGGTPAAPAATPPPTEPAKPEPVKINDPLVQSVLDSFGKVLEPEKPKPEDAPVPNVSLGEMAADIERRKAAAATAEPKPPEAAPAATPPPATPPVVPAAAAPPAAAAAPPAKPRVVPKPAAPAATPPAIVPPVSPDAAAEAAKKADEEYIKNLTPEQQDELAVAEYAEKNGKTGLRGEMLSYYRKFDKFLEENPKVDLDGDEAQEFIAANRPKWTQGEFRQAERKMLKEEAKSEVRKELAPDLEEQKRQLREIQSKPRIEQTVNDVAAVMTQDAEIIDPDVVKTLNEKGYQEAVKQYRVEAPIVARHLNAVRTWREIREGVTKFDENNPLHNWLMGFVYREGENMKGEPKEAQTLSDGRTFVPLAAFLKMSPEEAAQHWTYDDPAPDATSVSDLLAANGVIEAKRELQMLEQSGFKREKKGKAPAISQQPGTGTPPAAPPAATPPPADSGGSPRATGNVLPGASDGTAPPDPRHDFLESLMPGAAAIVGAR